MYLGSKKRQIDVSHTEHGYDFITLFFKNGRDMLDFSKRAYVQFKRTQFKYMELQRKEFVHIEGDVPRFHPDGEPGALYPDSFRHFHILYPSKPTQADWDELRTVLNNTRLNIGLAKDLPNREVKYD